jgi:lysophospholipase L1-like esterase
VSFIWTNCRPISDDDVDCLHNRIAQLELQDRAQLGGCDQDASLLLASRHRRGGAADAALIVAYGDSITDGARSTPETNHSWPALLAARLAAKKETANMLLEGINDIGHAATVPEEAVTADELIGAYKQIIDEAHTHGIQAIGCTLTPYGGASYSRENGEAIREALNAWIRTSGAFDAVVDFEAATRDAAGPKKIRAEFDPGDHLHPNDAGYQAMADRSIFRSLTGRRLGSKGSARQSRPSMLSTALRGRQIAARRDSRCSVRCGLVYRTAPSGSWRLITSTGGTLTKKGRVGISG